MRQTEVYFKIPGNEKPWFILGLVAVGGIFLFLVRAYLPLDDGRLQGDFHDFFSAAEALQRGDPIYVVGLDHRVAPPFMNPPFLALILEPLTHLPYAWARYLWSAIVYILVALSCRLLLGPCTTASQRFWLLATLLSAPVFMGNMVYGQNTALVLFGLALWHRLQQHERRWWGGLALGLVLVKPQLLLGPLVVLVASRRWRELFGLGTAALGLGSISLWLVGINGVVGYLQVANEVAGWVKLGGVERLDMNTPNGLLHGLLAPPIADVAVLLTGAFFAVLLAWRCLSLNNSSPGNNAAAMTSLSVVGSLLIGPYAHFYDLMILAAPWLLLGQEMHGWRLWLLGCSYAAVVAHFIMLGIGGSGTALTVLASAGLFAFLLYETGRPRQGSLGLTSTQ